MRIGLGVKQVHGGVLGEFKIENPARSSNGHGLQTWQACYAFGMVHAWTSATRQLDAGPDDSIPMDLSGEICIQCKPLLPISSVMANTRYSSYSVIIIATEVVAPALPMQHHRLPQSNIDLILPPVNVSVFFCYQNRATTKPSFASVVASLKKSLSEVLVSYYAFAGRLVTNSNGEPELLCNNEGVEFSEAYADIRLAQVDFHNPDATVEGKIVPSRSPFPDENNDRVAVFCVQVTKFKCGSVVVGCTFDNGNLVSLPYLPYAEAGLEFDACVGEVREKPLSWRAEMVHRAIKVATNEEHFRSLIDWVEMKRPEATLSKLYHDVSAVVVSSGLRFPISNLDFGWGKSAFTSYYFPWGGKAGYVMPMPSPLGEGSWVVYTHLSIHQLKAIESHPHSLLHPLTPHFLGLR
eukprot:Gb_26789 [translate_table: standard]